MKLNFMVVDTETVPNPDVDCEARSAQNRTVVPPAMCNVPVAISTMMIVDDAAYALESVEGDEIEMIRRFVDMSHDFDGLFVTWAGRFFDFPVLLWRCMHLGIPAPVFHVATERRYDNRRHWDLCDLMSYYGSTPKPKLLHACQNMGLPGKRGITGDMVAELYDQGRMDEVRKYCCEDVLQTGLLLMRWLHVRGEASTLRYNSVTRSALECAESLDIDVEGWWNRLKI